MLASLYLATLVGLGPQLNALAGSCVTPVERRLLPSPRGLGSLGDLWFTPVVSLADGGGGIELFDPLRLSMHGLAWSQLRLRVDGLDLTDPARPGTPLFEIPYEAWQGACLQSLWTSQPGFDLSLRPPADLQTGVSMALVGGGAIDGPLWTPHGLFDRDPAFSFGAPSQRRALQRAQEARASLHWAGPQGRGTLFAEALAHTHRYPPLALDDPAQRYTVLAAGQLASGLQLTAGWQHRSRSREGAAQRFAEALQATTDADAYMAQLGTTLTLLGGSQLQLALGAGWRQDHERRRSAEPVVIDLTDQWLWGQRYRPYVDLGRGRLDASLDWRLHADWRLSSRLSYAASRARPTDAATVVYTTLAGEPLLLTRMTAPTYARQALQGMRTDLSWMPMVGRAQLTLFAGLDAAVAGHADLDASGAAQLSFVSPAAGAALVVPLGGDLFVLVRREPWALDSTVGDFLDPGQGSGRIFTADDGVEVGRTGAAYHDHRPGLRRPFTDTFALGYTGAQLLGMRLGVQVAARRLVDRFTVDAQVQGAAAVQQVGDPGGDGRGESATPEGGQRLQSAQLSLQQLRSERFLLTNDPQAAIYLGFEFDLAAVDHVYWFARLGGAAYLSRGNAPLGNFADRNDPGSLSEESADAADKVHALGRYDHDRAFALKLLAGVEPLRHLSLALTVRYRDGEPFTRLLTTDATVPTVLMAVDRGEPRFTFAMTWDVRLRYAWPAAALPGALSVDIYNLFNSATEIAEDPRTGPSFRRSLEAMPGRALMVQLELGLPKA